MFLSAHTWYSYKYGVLSPEKLAEVAAKHKAGFVAITDINQTAGIAEAHRHLQAYHIKTIAGVDVRNGNTHLYTLLAMNNEGYFEINKFLSYYLNRKQDFPKTPPFFTHVFIIYDFDNAPEILTDEEFIGVNLNQLNRLRIHGKPKLRDHYVMLHRLTFAEKSDYSLHKVMRAIDKNTLITKLESHDLSSPTAFPPDWATILKLKQEFGFLIHNMEAVADRCSFEMIISDKAPVRNKRLFGKTLADDVHLIQHLCEEGMRYRFGNPRQEVIDRVEKEMKVITEKDFLCYFLINHDITAYARQKGYFYVGRGSGANSLIAYLLRITDVDPIELDLYFERFINPYRKLPPDFDIDFSWKDREDVTRYIFERYPNAVLLGSHAAFRDRGIVSEVGKAVGITTEEIKFIQRSPDHVKLDDPLHRAVKLMTDKLYGIPGHATIHSSGILVPEKEIYEVCATYMPPKGFPTTQIDMYTAEKVGLHKMDILGQRGLAKIKEALHVIRHNQPKQEDIDIHNINAFKKDEGIKNLIRKGNTLGCFYIESPATKSLLTKLRTDNFKGVVAASSIIRPGVAKSGMMREFIVRHREPAKRKSIHPILDQVLEETYGVMVYQEDVLKVANAFGGLSLGEADILRRSMSWKFRERESVSHVKDKFFDNCAAKGFGFEVVAEVWRQIESFANYAFAKGHSASYAVESYQCLYLKAYFPLEYMVASINNFGGFYSTEIYLHEARINGGNILHPCVNNGYHLTSIKGKDIYIGFQHMKDLQVEMAVKIGVERDQNGPYLDLEDFIERTSISLQQVIILIRINALRFTGKSKQELLWDAHFFLGGRTKKLDIPDLFRPEKVTYQLPPLSKSKLTDAYDELEILGFTVEMPFYILKEKPRNAIYTRDLSAKVGESVILLGYLVHVKRVATREERSRTMYFGYFIDEHGDFFDTVHFPDVAGRYPFSGKGCYAIAGKVTEDYDALSVEVSYMKKMRFNY